jgi:nitrile hydratase subunit beta
VTAVGAERIGEEVATIVQNPYGHTRLPSYVSGRRGRIVSYQGEFSLPDVAVFGRQRVEAVYTVCFAGEEVWGADAEPDSELCADLWESYLWPSAGRGEGGEA